MIVALQHYWPQHALQGQEIHIFVVFLCRIKNINGKFIVCVHCVYVLQGPAHATAL